jgi:hypothetical protein
MCHPEERSDEESLLRGLTRSGRLDGQIVSQGFFASLGMTSSHTYTFNKDKKNFAVRWLALPSV